MAILFLIALKVKEAQPNEPLLPRENVHLRYQTVEHVSTTLSSKLMSV